MTSSHLRRMVFAALTTFASASLAHASPLPDNAHASTPPSAIAAGHANDPYYDVVTEQGAHARGLYFPGHWVAQHGAQGVITTLRAAGLDAAVIDVKNDSGAVLFDTQVPELARVRTPVLRNLPEIIRTLHENHIYVIARMVCFKGSRLAAARPTHAAMDTRPEQAGRVWRSNSGDAWLDPADPDNHEMLRKLAVEVEQLGFDELQLDYIRFPVDASTAHARFPHLRARQERWEPIHSMLRMMDESLHIPMAVDIFGVAALGRPDSARLGQNVERWSEHIEVFCPMLYANNFRSWRPARGEDRGESFIREATAVMRRRVGDHNVIRPYMQAFAMGAGRPYNERMISGQVDAARTRQADGFLFWNPQASYSMVARGMRRPEAQLPFNWRTQQ